MSQDILFISPKTIKDLTQLHGNVADALIIPSIRIAQVMHIRSALGTALYNKLRNDISDNTLSGIYKTLVDDYLTITHVYFTMGLLPAHLTFQLYNKGLIRKTSDNTEVPDFKAIRQISDDYKGYAQTFMKDMIAFIIQQASVNSLFPEYTNPGNGVDTIFPDRKPYTMPFVLREVPQERIPKEIKYQGKIGIYRPDEF